MNTQAPLSQSNPPQSPPEIAPRTGQEEIIKEQPVPYDPNAPKPSEAPPIPGEGANNPEEPNNVPTPDPMPGREERIGFRIGEKKG